jgi:hypothetical protein
MYGPQSIPGLSPFDKRKKARHNSLSISPTVVIYQRLSLGREGMSMFYCVEVAQTGAQMK